MINVYSMNDCDWYAGETLDDAIRSYFGMMGEKDTPENREEYLHDPTVLSEEDMEHYTFHDLDGTWGDPKTEYTFRQALDRMIADGVTFPNFFASTEF